MMNNRPAIHSAIMIFAGFTLIVMMMELKRDPAPQPPPPVAQTSDLTMLRNCRDMGEPATRDPTCQRLWAAARDAFLGTERH